MSLSSAGNIFSNEFAPTAVDSRIHYPCYKSLDRYIDLKTLRSLDGYIAERINHQIKTRDADYFVNLHRLEENSPYQPGVREIWLSRTRPELPEECLDLVGETRFWEPTEAAEDFVLLMDFIETLPFQTTGRMIIFYDDAGRAVPAHRDHLDAELCQEFIWFRTNLKKPFYVLNEQTGEKKYVESYSAWFDSVNQFHGSDAAQKGLTFSVRVDGKFTDEFRNQIPQPEFNAASTPAFWACRNHNCLW